MSTVNTKEYIWLCCVLSCTVSVVTCDSILSQEVILRCATDGLLTGANKSTFLDQSHMSIISYLL